MILAFAWGAFWIGTVVGAVGLVLASFIWFTLTDEEMAKSRAVTQKMNEDARKAQRELYEERRAEVRRELEEGR